MVAGNENGDGDDAAVARRKARPLPYLAEQTVLRVLLKSGGD
jgi:hypothetical protein